MTPIATAVTTASDADRLYWRERNAIAPSKIMPAISCIAGVPVSRLSTSWASHRANSTAARPVAGTIHTNVIGRLLPPANSESRHVADTQTEAPRTSVRAAKSIARPGDGQENPARRVAVRGFEPPTPVGCCCSRTNLAILLRRDQLSSSSSTSIRTGSGRAAYAHSLGCPDTEFVMLSHLNLIVYRFAVSFFRGRRRFPLDPGLLRPAERRGRCAPDDWRVHEHATSSVPSREPTAL